MSTSSAKRDLVVLVADLNMKSAVEHLCRRCPALDIRPIEVTVETHRQRDNGCRKEGVAHLRPFCREYAHALLMFDHEGCGDEGTDPLRQEEILEQELAVSGWGDRAAVIVIAPELDVWVWSDSPHVDALLGWAGRQPGLREWLCRKRFLTRGQLKPDRPKEALEAALYATRQPRTSALYASLAKKVSLDRCTDRAFLKFKTCLRTWFGLPRRGNETRRTS